MHEEERARQAECARLAMLLEETRAAIRGEAEERRLDTESLAKRCSGLDAALQSGMEHTEQEFAIMKQSVLDLREAAQLEASTREECVARLQNLLDDEARAREDDIIKAGVAREAAENRLEQHLQTMLYEERALREDIESQLEAKAAAMLHDLNFEKARFAAQGRELSQAVASTREALASETTARRNELGAMTKTLEELRNSLTDETTMRERCEARLLEQ